MKSLDKKKDSGSVRIQWLPMIKHGFHVVRGFFPLTWLSLILGALLYYTWFWEVSSHANQILYTVVLLLVLVFIVILFFTLLGSILVFLITRKNNTETGLNEKNEVGGHIVSNYRIFSPFFLPFVTIETSLMDEAFKRHVQRRSIWEYEWLEPISRGRYHTLHRKMTIHDIFGLTAISFVMKQTVSLEIHPATQNYEMHAFQTQTTGDGYSHPQADPKGELVEMRRYQAGDPLRLVLWKVFARSRKLVVRSPEPAITEQNDMFVYFVSGKNDEASASVAKAFLSAFSDSNAENLQFAADGAHRIVSNKADGISDIIDSVDHRTKAGQDLLAIAPLVSQQTIDNCFLLVPPSPGSWMDLIKQFITQYHVRPVFIISMASQTLAFKSVKKSFWRKIMTSSEDEAFQESMALNKMCEQLNSMGTVRIVDMTTGASKDWQKAE